jgi:hypothetical protein
MNQQRLRVPCLRHTIKLEKPSPSPRHNRLRYPKSLASLWFQPRGYARESYLRSGYVMGGLTGWWLEPGSWKAACYQTQAIQCWGKPPNFRSQGRLLGASAAVRFAFHTGTASGNTRYRVYYGLAGTPAVNCCYALSHYHS